MRHNRRFRPTIEGLESRLSLSDVALLGGDAPDTADTAECDPIDDVWDDPWADPWADIGVAEETPDVFGDPDDFTDDPCDPWDALPDIEGIGPEPPDLVDGQPDFGPFPPAPVGPAGPA